MLAVKSRMELRGQLLEKLEAAPPPVSPPPPALPQSTVANMDRCRSLKERIHERLERPATIPGARPSYYPGPSLNMSYSALPRPTTMLPYEATKDMYAHEVPFPVKTVYEVTPIPNPQSVPIETEAGRIPETLLLAAESAALVQSLEERLGQALLKISRIEGEHNTVLIEKETLVTKLVIAEKEILSLNARNEELGKQNAATRLECQTEIDALKVAHGATVAKALDDERAAGAMSLTRVAGETSAAEARVTALLTDKARLEELVTELRNQLTQNAQTLQISTQTVKSLTSELLQAKQQSSFVSGGYKKLEADLRAANALVCAKDAEIAALKPVADEMPALREALSVAQRDLGLINATATNLRGADAEVMRLRDIITRLERDVGDKDLKLGELKAHVDHMRQQANTAYLHAKGFNAQNGMGGGAEYVDPCPVHGGGMTPAGLNVSQGNPLDTLRREVELEAQRFQEESRRWKSRLAQSPVRKH